jgi:hypothetical protein
MSGIGQYLRSSQNHPVPVNSLYESPHYRWCNTQKCDQKQFCTYVNSACLWCFVLHSLFFVTPGLSLSALQFVFWQKCAGIGNKHKAITLSRCWHSSQKHRAPNMCRWPGSWNNRSGGLSYIVNWRSIHFTIVRVIITRLMVKKVLPATTTVELHY